MEHNRCESVQRICGNMIINAKGGKHSERDQQMTEKL